MVPAPHPSPSIQARQNRIHLVASYVADQWLVAPFDRNCLHPCSADTQATWFRKATTRKKERIAVSRTLRLRMQLPLCCSRDSKNPRIVGASSASKVSTARAQRPFLSRTNWSSSRKSVSVAGNSLGADLPMLSQVFGKEALQRWPLPKPRSLGSSVLIGGRSKSIRRRR